MPINKDNKPNLPRSASRPKKDGQSLSGKKTAPSDEPSESTPSETPENANNDDQIVWQQHIDQLFSLDHEVRLSSPVDDDGELYMSNTPHYPPYDADRIDSIPGIDTLTYAHSSMSPSRLKKLFSDPYPVDQTLDLHHLFAPAAYESCQSFLLRAYLERDRRCRLICGFGHHTQGHSRLKGVCVFILKRCPFVLAYQSAAPKDGGTGAINIYLRKKT